MGGSKERQFTGFFLKGSTGGSSVHLIAGIFYNFPGSGLLPHSYIVSIETLKSLQSGGDNSSLNTSIIHTVIMLLTDPLQFQSIPNRKYGNT